MERRIENRQLVYILVLFLIAQFFGFMLVYASFTQSYVLISEFNTETNTNFYAILIQFVINILIAIGIIMLIMRYYKGETVFKLFEAFFILVGSFFLFFMMLALVSSNDTVVGLASVILALLVLWIKNRTNGYRNFITMISSMGYGAFIGLSFSLLFGFLIVYAFLAMIAVYDYVAVFVLKFMIPFARKASSMNLAFMIGSSNVEVIPKEKLTKKETTYLKKEDMSKFSSPTLKKLVKEGHMPVISSAMLGNGDIMLPLMVTVGSYIAFMNVFVSLMTIVGSGVGLIFTLYLLKKYKIGLPAIPPLFSFISLSLFVVFLIGKPFQPLMVVLFLSASIISIVMMIITIRRIVKRSKKD